MAHFGFSVCLCVIIFLNYAFALSSQCYACHGEYCNDPLNKDRATVMTCSTSKAVNKRSVEESEGVTNVDDNSEFKDWNSLETKFRNAFNDLFGTTEHVFNKRSVEELRSEENVGDNSEFKDWSSLETKLRNAFNDLFGATTNVFNKRSVEESRSVGNVDGNSEFKDWSSLETKFRNTFNDLFGTTKHVFNKRSVEESRSVGNVDGNSEFKDWSSLETKLRNAFTGLFGTTEYVCAKSSYYNNLHQTNMTLRGCIPKSTKGMEPCTYLTNLINTGYGKVRTCTFCDTDLCNSGISLRNSVVTIILVSSILKIIF